MLDERSLEDDTVLMVEAIRADECGSDGEDEDDDYSESQSEADGDEVDSDNVNADGDGAAAKKGSDGALAMGAADPQALRVKTLRAEMGLVNGRFLFYSVEGTLGEEIQILKESGSKDGVLRD